MENSTAISGLGASNVTLTEFNYNEYLNISKELPLDYAEYMYGYSIPICLLITGLFNTLIVIVLSREHMRTPSNACLMAMAVCDMLTLLFPSPWLFYMYTLGNHYEPLTPVAACYIYNLMNEVMPMLFHTASIWLTVLLAIQRYIYVCHPPLARRWCTMENVSKYIIWICVAASAHQITRFFEKVYDPVTIVWRGKEVVVCKVRYASWISDVLTLDIYFSAYYLFRVLFVHLGPCISLVWLNLHLFKAVRVAQKNRTHLFQSKKSKQRESYCTTYMLFVVVCVFLLTEIPLAIVTVLHVISSSIVEILDYDIVNVLILFTNFFIIVSYPINFAIYCGMSRQFRETFKDLFSRWFNLDRASRSTTRDGKSTQYSMVGHPTHTITVTGPNEETVL